MGGDCPTSGYIITKRAGTGKSIKNINLTHPVRERERYIDLLYDCGFDQCVLSWLFTCVILCICWRWGFCAGHPRSKLKLIFGNPYSVRDMIGVKIY